MDSIFLYFPTSCSSQWTMMKLKLSREDRSLDSIRRKTVVWGEWNAGSIHKRYLPTRYSPSTNDRINRNQWVPSFLKSSILCNPRVQNPYAERVRKFIDLYDIWLRMSLDKNWMWYFSFNVCMQLQKVLSCPPSQLLYEECWTRVGSTITIHHRDTNTSTTDRINRNHSSDSSNHQKSVSFQYFLMLCNTKVQKPCMQIGQCMNMFLDSFNSWFPKIDVQKDICAEHSRCALSISL